MFIGILGVALVVVVGMCINFDNANSSSVINDNMPWKFHDRYYMVSGVLVFISLFSFFASFYEVSILFTVNNLTCTLAMVGLILLGAGNEVTSSLISEKMNNKCDFVLPVFSQDMLMSYGCNAKYTSFEDDVTKLTCPKIEQTRVWEDNVDLLIDDQKTMFGCLNTECCTQVQILVSSRLTVLTVSCIVTAVYLFMFIINSQYMVKVMARFNTRWLNHHGDALYLAPFLVILTAFLCLKYSYKFEQNGPPIVSFQPIVPKGSAVYSYYGLPNPKQKKEPTLLQLSSDPYLSSFSFSDITKVLPYSDPACPGDGTCHDDIQAMIVLKMKQETDMTKKTKSFFQLNIARNASASERESLQELVKKNETNQKGDLYLEGSQKQLKNMLKNHLLVKPGCLFDNAITLSIKVYYMSTPGTYSEAHTRSVDYEMAQI